jgi:hypothetical protein
MVSVLHMVTRQEPSHKLEHVTTTNGGGILRSISWPSGLSDSAIESILNR